MTLDSDTFQFTTSCTTAPRIRINDGLVRWKKHIDPGKCSQSHLSYSSKLFVIPPKNGSWSYRVVNRIIEFLRLFRTRVELQTGIMSEYIVPCPGGRRTTLCNCISARGQIDDLLTSHFANLRTTYSTMKTTVLQFFRRILIYAFVSFLASLLRVSLGCPSVPRTLCFLLLSSTRCSVRELISSLSTVMDTLQSSRST